MNCEEVQTQLLEYLDRSLDTITTRHFELHLTSCLPCREEANSLADCIQQVAALPIVEPPLGFAQRVMAHAREIDRTPNLWHRLAAAWRHGTPIHATAVVLIAVLAVFLYRQEQPSPLLEPLPTQTNAEQPTTPPEELAAASITTPAEVTPPVTADRTPAPRQEAPVKSAAVTPTPAASNVTPPAEQEIREPIPSVAPRRAPIPVQEIATGREAARRSGESFGFGDLTFGGPRQSALRSAAPSSGPFFSINEPSPDLEFVVRRRSLPQRDSAESEKADASRRSAESDASAPNGAGRRAPSSLSAMIVETRWFTVAHEHLEYFRKDLAAETIIESESTGTKREKEMTDRGERPLAIKVIILPATDR